MTRFVIAFASLHNNELDIEFREGDSILRVASEFVAGKGYLDIPNDIEAVKELCFSGDCLLEIKEIP